MAKSTKKYAYDDIFIDTTNDSFIFHHHTIDPGPAPGTSPLTAISMLSDEFCPRQISFTIPGKAGVLVTATEDDGKINFVVDVLGDPKPPTCAASFCISTS